jgi:hypothetical protein
VVTFNGSAAKRKQCDLKQASSNIPSFFVNAEDLNVTAL